ncbi:MAG: hypothetical protein Ta2A_02310 [Treponemataceae bacterium]|nr:MAG: hypothetical protein Ta2A_02310 [Treponemataceae bacterium]
MTVYLIIPLAILLLVVANVKNIAFFLEGSDLGLTAAEISVLKKLAKLCKLENPKNLFHSYELLDNSIKKVIAVSTSSKSGNKQSHHEFLGKLFAYRTKVEHERKEDNALKSTTQLAVGQKLRVLFKDSPVAYTSDVLGSGDTLIISYPVPVKPSVDTSLPESMTDVPVELSFFIRYDATYLVKTKIVNQGSYHNRSVLILQKTNKVERVQKREAVRATCKFPGELFVRESSKSVAGIPCLVENISITGALISLQKTTGGEKGHTVKIKFSIRNSQITMQGRVKFLKVDQEFHKTFLHIQGEPIAPAMKNMIQSYVYDVMPESKLY